MGTLLGLILGLFIFATATYGQGAGTAASIYRTTFANLGSPSNGSVRYVTDGTPNTSPCTGSGTGAFAQRTNGVWVCSSATVAPTPAPVDATYITETTNGTLTNEFALGSLPTGPLANTITMGVPRAATATDISMPLFCSDAGANDTYACSLSPAPASYVVGTHIRFFANTANTGAASINFNSLGALTIVKVAGGITTALADNDIRAGQWVDGVIATGSNFQIQSTLGNAASGGTSKAVLGTGGGGQVITAGSTELTAPFDPNFGIGAPLASETDLSFSVPYAGTVKNLVVRTAQTDSVGGTTITVTVRKNGVDTALTLSAGNRGLTFSDTTHSFSVAQLDLITISLVAVGGFTSSGVASISIELDSP